VDLRSQYTLGDSLAFNKTVINKISLNYEFIGFYKDGFGLVYKG
jgi:hypothetical protein